MVTFVAKGTSCPSLPQAAARWLGDAAPLDKRLLSAVCCQALFSETVPWKLSRGSRSPGAASADIFAAPSDPSVLHWDSAFPRSVIYFL